MKQSRAGIKTRLVNFCCNGMLDGHSTPQEVLIMVESGNVASGP